MKINSVNSVEPTCRNKIILSITAEGIGTANTRNSKGKSAALKALMPNTAIKDPFKKTTAERTVKEVRSFWFNVILLPAMNKREATIIMGIPMDRE